jgi:hypothetical protein
VANKKVGGPKITMRTVKAPVDSTPSLRDQIFIRLSALKKGEALEIAGMPKKRHAYIRSQVSTFNKKSKTKFAVGTSGDIMIVAPK